MSNLLFFSSEFSFLSCFRKLTKDEECVLEKNLVFKLAPELIFKVEFKDEEDPEN